MDGFVHMIGQTIQNVKVQNLHVLVFWEQWGSEIQTFKIWKHLKSRLFEDQISNGQVFKWLGFHYGYRPNRSKTGTFEIRMFLSRFQMVFDKMVPTCPDFKWLGIGISDPIQNSDHMQPNLFLTI